MTTNDALEAVAAAHKLAEVTGWSLRKQIEAAGLDWDAIAKRLP